MWVPSKCVPHIPANERLQDEINRSRQLQDQLDAVYVSNNDLKQELTEVDEARQALASTLSDRLNELAKLTEELQDAQKRIEVDAQTNAKLTENVEMFLTEKTQLATEVLELENQMAELEQTNAAKLGEMERNANSQLLALEQQKDAKLAEVEQAWKSRYEEEMKKVDVKLTDANAQMKEIEKQNADLKETVEKLRSDLETTAKQLEQEKERGKELDAKISDIQTMLHDRDNEITSLNSKLNGEHKRVDKEMERMEELNTKLKDLQMDNEKKVSDLENQLEIAQKETEVIKAKNEKLENEMKDQAAKINAMESTISEKEKEQAALQEKTEKDGNELRKLSVQLAEQKSTIQSLEEKLKAKIQEDIRSNVENLNNVSTAQITSTPLRHPKISESLDVPLTKRMRLVDNDVMSVQSSISNYTSFQGNVDRKRDSGRFFTRKSPVHAKKKPEARSFFARSEKQHLDDELISLAVCVGILVDWLFQIIPDFIEYISEYHKFG